jgi:hypothetical protein
VGVGEEEIGGWEKGEEEEDREAEEEEACS